MNTHWLHKLLSTLLAFTVLFSTFSFTVESHFCGDNLVDVALFTKVKTCGMESNNTSSKTTVSNKNCCQNHVDLVKGQDKLKLAVYKSVSFTKVFYITALISKITSNVKGLLHCVVPFKSYSPPDLVVNIQLVDSVFII